MSSVICHLRRFIVSCVGLVSYRFILRGTQRKIKAGHEVEIKKTTTTTAKKKMTAAAMIENVTGYRIRVSSLFLGVASE